MSNISNNPTLANIPQNQGNLTGADITSEQTPNGAFNSLATNPDLSAFTLKIQSNLKKNPSDSGTLLVNKNGAPALPEPLNITKNATKPSSDDPLGTTTTGSSDELNVYMLAEKAADINSQSQLEAVSASIAGENGEANIRQADINNQQNDLNQEAQNAQQAAKAMAAAKKSNSTSSDTGWALNSLMVLGGGILIATGLGAGVGASLIIGASLSMVAMSSAGKKGISDLTTALEQAPAKLSPRTASILSQATVAVVIMGCSMGGEASGMGEALELASATGSSAARSGLDASASAGSRTMDTSTDSGLTSSSTGSKIDPSTTTDPVTTKDPVTTTGSKTGPDPKTDPAPTTGPAPKTDPGTTTGPAPKTDPGTTTGPDPTTGPAPKTDPGTNVDPTSNEAVEERVASLNIKSEWTSARYVEAFGKSLLKSTYDAGARTVTSGKNLVTGVAKSASDEITHLANDSLTETASRYATSGYQAGQYIVKSGIKGAQDIVGSGSHAAASIYRVGTEELNAATEVIARFASDPIAMAKLGFEEAVKNVQEAYNAATLARAAKVLYKLAPQGASLFFACATIAQSAIKIYTAHLQEEALEDHAEALQNQGAADIAGTYATQMEDLIDTTNTMVNEMLTAINSEIDQTGSVLSEMASPLNNLSS